MDPERRERIRKRTEEFLAELPLQELRQARALSQQELAEVLGLNQATVSKLERRTDMYLSSLRRFVEAMGGELEISASFRHGHPQGCGSVGSWATPHKVRPWPAVANGRALAGYI